MKRLLFLFLAIVIQVGPVSARGGEAEPKLRGWYLGWQRTGGGENQYDIFGRDELPGGTVENPGHGGGFFIGHRFGQRFLFGLQFVGQRHDLANSADDLLDGQLIFTGTVLFFPKAVLQPFLRGGVGGSFEVLARGGTTEQVYAYGTAAIAGGGVQIRLSSRFSLDFETVATFSNFLEVQDESSSRPWPEKKWRVLTSSYGVRVGIGAMIWF